MQKRAIRPGFHDKMMSGNSYKDWLDLTKYVHDVLNLSGYPISNDCCISPPSSTDVGKVLTIGADGKIALATVAGVSGTITSVSSGTTTATTQQIVVVGGVNFNLNSATTSLAGLMSSTDKTTLTNLPTTLAGKQDLLVSGTNIKTVNGIPLLGSGDIVIAGGSPFTALTGEATSTAAGGATTLSNAAIIGKVLTGYTSSTGIISATDTILQAIGKLNGNTTSISANTAALITLSGVAAGATSLGTFTGTTIADNLTGKAALQSLETALELLPIGAESGTHVDPTSKKVRLGGVLLENAAIDGNSLFGFDATNLKTASLVTDATGTAQSSLILGKLLSQPTRLKTMSVTTPTTMSELVIDADGNSQFVQKDATNSAGLQLSSTTEAKIKNNTYSLGVKADGIYAETLGAKTIETEVVYVDSTTGKLSKGTVATPSGSTKYAVTVSGATLQLTARVKATPGVTIAKTNSSTITFTIPAGGYIDNYEVYYGTGELPGANTTHIFNYTSNTVTNQGLSTADAPDIKAWYNDTLPVNIFHARNIGSADDFVTQIVAIGSGNITMLMDWNSGSTGLGTNPFVVKGNF